MRFGLHLSKLGRRRHRGDDQAFYQTFFNEKHVDEARYDFRHILRRTAVTKALAETSWALASGLTPVIVDIGSGVGDIISAVPANWLRVAFAYSTTDIELARSTRPLGVIFVRGSAFALPFRSGTLDAVLFLEVLEHLADELQALAEISRVLKPGGLLIISVPGTFYFDDYFELIGHYRHYTRETLLNLLSRAGISVVKYLDQHYALAKLHYYPYMALATADRLLNGCGFRARSLYVRPVIGRVYAMMCHLLHKCANARSQADLAFDSRSTFLVGRKMDIARAR
jgi:SAM-dependent methyltransferase